MIKRLLTGTDWDYAGIKFKDSQPMLIERKTCKVKQAKDSNLLIVHVEGGSHPFKQDATASADHYISRDSISGISFYSETRETIIMPVVKGKIIAQA